MKIPAMLSAILLLSLTTMVAAKDPNGQSDNQNGDPAEIPYLQFDCTVPSSLDEVCVNNGTCPEIGGLCQCADGFEGNDCSVATDTTIDKCDPECEMDAKCYQAQEDADPECHCPDAYYGNTCQLRRVTHECNSDNMELKVAPYDGFLGSIYVYEQEADDKCVLEKDQMGGFSKQISFDDCGGAENETDSNGDANVFFSVIVQYDDLVGTYKDEELVFVCKVRPAGSDITWDATPFQNSKKKNLRKQKVEKEFNPIDITMTTKDGQPIKEAQVLGTEVVLIFTLMGGEVYDSFRVEHVVASNGLQGSKASSLDLVSKGCVTDIAYNKKKLVTSLSGNPKDAVKLTMKVFRLKYSDQVSFLTKVKLCKGDKCNSTMCDADIPFEGLGRKKRQAPDTDDDTDGEDDDQDDQDTTFKTYRTNLWTWYPTEQRIYNQQQGGASVPNPRHVASTDNDARMSVFNSGHHRVICPNAASASQNEDKVGFVACLSNVGFLVLVIVLVVLLLLVLAIVAILCVRLAHHRDDSRYHENKAYS